ncbi:MAG: hypothetical protein EOO74_08635, partial [Myxococcales bacterium]
MTVVVSGLVLGLFLTACSGDGESTSPSATPTTAPPTTAAPVPPRPDPKVGACHELAFDAATEAVDKNPPVPCRKEHTSVTFAVGQLDLLDDGHLLAMDSAQVGAQLDTTCERGVRDWVGGSAEDFRLSRFRSIWFRPDVKEADRGAAWYRCDVVAVAREGKLARLDGDLKGALD